MTINNPTPDIHLRFDNQQDQPHDLTKKAYQRTLGRPDFPSEPLNESQSSHQHQENTRREGDEQLITTNGGKLDLPTTRQMSHLMVRW